MTFALLYKVYSNIKLQYVVLQCWKSYKIKPQMHTTARRPAAQTPSLSSQMTLLWGDESAYRDEFCKLSEWCSINNLEPDTSKTSKPHQLQGPGRGDMWREWPASNHLTWAVNITPSSEEGTAAALLPEANLSFHHCSVESILTSDRCGGQLHCGWQWSCAENHPISTENHRHTATIIYIYRSRCPRRATNIITSHPGNRLFTLLPSGRR